ncbi:hypothetical protein Scep_012371 [Stephania cephalantha]|uniref:Uncharacterized protein n=1 Tax=Stephania cephalantha TaxID=152367 RepID=A0AAP0JGR5_9MAGN
MACSLHRLSVELLQLQIEGRLLRGLRLAWQRALRGAAEERDESRPDIAGRSCSVHLEAEEDRVVVALELGEVEKLGRDAVEFLGLGFGGC